MNKIILKGQERSLTIRLYLRSTENNHLLEHPPSLTLDSAKTMESVTPDSGMRNTLPIVCTRQYPFITGVLKIGCESRVT